MAKMNFKLPEDLFEQLLDSDFTEIAEESLKKASPTLEESVKREVSSVIKDKERKGLINSVSAWKKGVIKAKSGAYMLGVSFTGKPETKSNWTSHTHGKAHNRITTNNDIAWWLEHGNAHQAAKPFIDRAARNVEGKIDKILQEVFDKKVGAK